MGNERARSCRARLAYSREGIPKSPFMTTVVVILEDSAADPKALDNLDRASTERLTPNPPKDGLGDSPLKKLEGAPLNLG